MSRACAIATATERTGCCSPASYRRICGGVWVRQPGVQVDHVVRWLIDQLSAARAMRTSFESLDGSPGRTESEVTCDRAPQATLRLTTSTDGLILLGMPDASVEAEPPPPLRTAGPHRPGRPGTSTRPKSRPVDAQPRLGHVLPVASAGDPSSHMITGARSSRIELRIEACSNRGCVMPKRARCRPTSTPRSCKLAANNPRRIARKYDCDHVPPRLSLTYSMYPPSRPAI